jgi:hypothetical protein
MDKLIDISVKIVIALLLAGLILLADKYQEDDEIARRSNELNARVFANQRRNLENGWLYPNPEKFHPREIDYYRKGDIVDQ